MISHLLMRRWQVASPEVDIGDDLLVAQDLARVLRVQVKTCRAKEQKTSYVGQFRLPVAQVATPQTPELFFVFALFRRRAWSDFIIVSRRTLHEEHVLYEVGSATGTHFTLRIRLDEASVRCGGRDWSGYRADWSALFRADRLPPGRG